MAFLAPHTTPARIFYSLEAASPEECEMLEEWVKINPDLDLNTFYNDDGWTLLLQLVANAPAPHAGHFRIARLLLSHGADINLCHPSICGLAPLHFALKRMTSRLRGGPTDKQLAMISADHRRRNDFRLPSSGSRHVAPARGGVARRMPDSI